MICNPFWVIISTNRSFVNTKNNEADFFIHGIKATFVTNFKTGTLNFEKKKKYVNF